jgi:hypothetical protein
MKVEINVTQEHIDNGLADKCFACPVALALSEKVKPAAAVHRGLILIGEKNLSQPLSVAEFVNDFDEGVKVEPFSFSLDIPEEYLRSQQ